MIRLTAILLAMLAAGSAGPAFSQKPPDILGLVVGIDDYRHVSKLEGAVNDARDIAATLERAGARDVRLLLDRQATREAILGAWDELVARAQPGSLVVLSYAGHGAQMKELVPGTEADGKDEFWVLADFQPRGPGVHHKVIDDDIARMLAKAAHLDVLMVSDSCHSGTMTRSLDRRAGRRTTRAATFGPLDEDPLLLPDPEAARKDIADFENVTFFAAVPDHLEVPEVEIEQQKRGALSWSFSRAIEGQADRDGDGRTSKDELERFIRENVRMKVDGLQNPQVIRGGTGTDVALPMGLPRPPAAEPPRLKGRKTIPLLVLNAGDIPVDAVLQSLSGVVPADELTPGRFTWDIGRGEVVSALGDLIAEVKGGDVESQLSRVQGVVEKWRVLALIEEDAQRRSLEIRIDPGERRFRESEQVTFVVDGADHPYFTLVNLSSDGTVNFLYPLRGDGFDDPLEIPAGRPFELPLQVTPPFGAEHIVAIASAQPLTGLHAALKAIDGDQETAQIPDLLTAHLTGKTYQIGVHGVFTAP